MTRQTGPACGNNPGHPMSDGDRRVVDDFQAYLAQRATIRDRVADTLRPWLPGADEADVAHAATAVLNFVLREAAASIDATFTGPGVDRSVRHAATLLRRIADETTATETQPERCEHCGQPITRVTGTLAAWWVHAPGGNTVCDWARAAVSTRATPTPEAQQGEPWPVKEASRRYAEQLRATPGQAARDGHTGWECHAGASLLVSASTPGPGALGTHHGTIYACTVHRAAAAVRIMGAGYEADPRPAPPGHRWNPWPCGHVTAYSKDALSALADEPVAGAAQDGAQG
ncbi:hypothetical protein [Streptomyces sp. STCH 565 A]|uniref:hypothetical protein n=1 Tax=Streptomyces sp. STCH 565 A TaxID=2950532 RepID=UPI002075EF81|nr:hypothetical protein [Streptomyces sp. STCH 565 A]MCM8548940.1 hypothetical protein [Streptomyces sp. STCH 565 A]